MDILGESLIERAKHNHEQIHGQEHAQRGSARARAAGDEIADEGNGDHHRAGCNHGYGHCIEELGLGQPMMLLDHSSVKKRNNRQAAAKDKQTRFKKEKEQRTCGAKNTQAKRNKRNTTSVCIKFTWWSAWLHVRRDLRWSEVYYVAGCRPYQHDTPYDHCQLARRAEEEMKVPAERTLPGLFQLQASRNFVLSAPADYFCVSPSVREPMCAAKSAD